VEQASQIGEGIWWTVGEAARYLQVSKPWVRSRVRARLLKAYRYPGSNKMRFLPDDVRKFALTAWQPYEAKSA
jgi:excisionase family DNA binding protein